MATISELCRRRSTSETTQAALGNTSRHSANVRFVVTRVLLFCYRREISSNIRSA